MFRKITVCLLVLLLAVGVAGAQERPVDRAAWVERLTNLQPNTQENVRVIQEFNTLDPAAGFALLQEAWKDISATDARILLLNNLTEHPRIVDILHLGATDSSLVVQNRTLQLLENFSFQNFAEDYSAYLLWHQQMTGKPLETVLKESCRRVVASNAKAEEAQRLVFLSNFQRISYATPATKVGRMRRAALVESGLPDLLAQWITQPNTIWGAFAILRYLRMDESYLRRVVVPLAGKGTEPNMRRQAISLLGSPDNRWVAPLLLKQFVEEYPDAEAETLGYAVAATGDPHALPTIIALLDADKSAEGLRILSGILANMTGLNAGTFHDGAWWHAWWTKNSIRFSDEVRALPFPRLIVRARPAPPAGIGLPARPEQHQVANDVKRTYWLIRPAAGAAKQINAPAGRIDAPPAPPILRLRSVFLREGNAGNKISKLVPDADKPNESLPGLLVVLPPDGNGAEATGFWESVAHKALKDRCYIAVAVAPKWSVDQNVTWITRENMKTVKEAKFSVESFVADIVKDVTATHSIAPDRIYLHGAMESGPVAYACSLEETTPFKGFYILASGFKSAQLPPLAHAKNRKYLLQHSQDDKIAPYVLAAAAQKLLTDQGATVKLLSYRGGHGYTFTDDPWEQIGAAVTWLETGK